MPELGRGLIAIGLSIALLGVLLLFSDRLPLGRLPGDIVVRRENFTCAVPLATMLLLSIVLTVILNLLARWRG